MGKNREKGKQLIGNGRTEMQKCDHCKKYAGGCSWTDTDPKTDMTKFQPVEGWTAEKTEIGYHITDCPEFVSDGTEERDLGPQRELKWDIVLLLKLIRRGMTDEEIHRRMGGIPLSTILAYKARLRKLGAL